MIYIQDHSRFFCDFKLSTALILHWYLPSSSPKPFYSANRPTVFKHIRDYSCLDGFEMAKHHPDLIFCRKQAGESSTTIYNTNPLLFRCCNWPTLWQMWWKMCHLWLICPSINFSSNLWWVQLWILSGNNSCFWLVNNLS